MIAGALVGLALYALDFAVGGGGFMGMRDPRVLAEVMSRARAQALEQQLLGLAVLMVAGALFGTAGAACARAWGRRSPAFAVAGALAGHGYFLLRSMAQFPQLYSAAFYERGGVRRAAMLLVTDYVSVRALDVTLTVVLAALFLPPLFSRRAWTQKRAAVLIAVVLIAGTAALASRRTRPTVHAHAHPNILVIAVDSLRADRVFGDARFPALQQLAARGVRFREAYVTQARTFPSFVTLLTGRYSAHHGIRHEFPSAAARAAIGPSLPSLLRAAGWRTSVVSDFAGEIFSRAPLGFEHVEVPRLDLFNIVAQQIVTAHPSLLPYASTRWGRRLFPSMGITAELEDPAALAERAAAEIDRLAGEPFFLTVFFTAPHTPYASPAWQRFADRRYRGPLLYLKQPLPQLAMLPPVEAAQVQALYDGAVGAVDDAIAQLLARLDEDGLTDNTIVVLLGDHGENLFDVPGRGMGHGDHLWGELANHIPLVIADGRHAPREVSDIVRDVDLTPTLSALAGIAAPPGDGVDLSPLMRGESLALDAYEETGLWLLTSGPGYRAEDRMPYPDLWHTTEAAADGDIFLQPRFESPTTDAKVRAIRTARWKLVYQPTPSGVHWRLFDVVADPAERQDVADSHPDVVAELRARLQAWISDTPAAATPSPR